MIFESVLFCLKLFLLYAKYSGLAHLMNTQCWMECKNMCRLVYWNIILAVHLCVNELLVVGNTWKLFSHPNMCFLYHPVYDLF